MSVKVKIQLTEQAQKVVAGLKVMPGTVLGAVASAMGKENLLTVSYIQREHLTGQGPFPVEQHKLGVVTNRLRSSLNASTPVVQGQQVISDIGSNVKYAAIHEFGGRIHHSARQTTLRHRVDARGNLLRQLNHPNLAVFAGRKHKRARATEVTIPAHDVNMPERAPIRTGIAACAPNYSKSISRAIVQAWKSLEGGAA